MWRLFLIILLWMAVFSSPAVAGEDDRDAFKSAGCPECHAVTRPPSTFGIAERGVEKGPNLWYAGSKFQPSWLEKWLEAPTPIALIRYDRLLPDLQISKHPALHDDGLRAVLGYLTSLTDPEMATGVIDTARPMERMEKIQGRILFGKNQQCFGCHKTVTRYGQQVGGASAPSLASAFERLNQDWIYAFLMNQTRYTPVTRMPIYRGKTYTQYGERQMHYLARYIAEMGAPRHRR